MSTDERTREQREIDERADILIGALRRHCGADADILVECAEIARESSHAMAGNPTSWELVSRGRSLGRAAVLLRQLRLRFGEIEPDVATRVSSASLEEHLAMAERILTATSAAEVVG